MKKPNQDILNMLSCYFPDFYRDIELWKPVGKNGVMIRKKRGEEFIFTYYGKNDWCFETAKHRERTLE